MMKGIYRRICREDECIEGYREELEVVVEWYKSRETGI
jgi:hypothetical protein